MAPPLGETHFFRMLISIKRRTKFGFYTSCPFTTPYVKPNFFSTNTTNSSFDLDDNTLDAKKEEESPLENAAHVLSKWGCSVTDVAAIFERQPSLRETSVTVLESKLLLLSELGIQSSDLVKMINCRPRFLNCRLNHYFDERLNELRSLFGSKAAFLKAIVRNPSLLVYDFHKTVKPVISLYEEMGVSRSEFISMLLLRPTLIPRTHMSKDKIELIRRTGVKKESKMYKYVVTIMGVSRIETISEKLANLEKFGFSEDEVLELFGRSPLLMTLSVDKVQRNMTFVVGTMKMSEKHVFNYPFLLYANLEDVLKPRVLLGGKIQDMDLFPQIKGSNVMTALRMSEKRFLKAFVLCHEEDVREELLEYYQTAKGMKRLAETSKKTFVTNGFPF